MKFYATRVYDCRHHVWQSTICGCIEKLSYISIIISQVFLININSLPIIQKANSWFEMLVLKSEFYSGLKWNNFRMEWKKHCWVYLFYKIINCYNLGWSKDVFWTFCDCLFVAERAKRRKTWSGSPSKVADPVLDADDLEVDRTMGSTEYLAPHHRRQENMYI